MADARWTITGTRTLRVPSDKITGVGRANHLADGVAPSRVRMAKAFFEPGARTVWHRHFFSQILHVVDGILLVQERGSEPRAVRAGESVSSTPGAWHWHGADLDHMLTVIAVFERNDDGEDAEWGDAVDDATYATAHGQALPDPTRLELDN